jgi:hypothetical protein
MTENHIITFNSLLIPDKPLELFIGLGYLYFSEIPKVDKSMTAILLKEEDGRPIAHLKVATPIIMPNMTTFMTKY